MHETFAESKKRMTGKVPTFERGEPVKKNPKGITSFSLRVFQENHWQEEDLRHHPPFFLDLRPEVLLSNNHIIKGSPSTDLLWKTVCSVWLQWVPSTTIWKTTSMELWLQKEKEVALLKCLHVSINSGEDIMLLCFWLHTKEQMAFPSNRVNRRRLEHQCRVSTSTCRPVIFHF